MLLSTVLYLGVNFMMAEFTDAIQFLGKGVKLSIDRPSGSHHPEHGFLYPLNYGFVPGTLAPDGEEVDGYVLGITEPLAEFYGRCIAIIHRLNDEDDKLVVVPPEKIGITDEEIRQQTCFQEQYFASEIIR